MKFYVYELLRPDGTVFYVGKGSGKRVTDHEREASHGHTCHKCRTIRKIWESGKDFSSLIVFRTDSESEAFEKEKQLIAQYGRNNLTNCTDGGEGTVGWVATDEFKKKISDRLSLKWKDSSYRKYMSDKSRAAMSSAETKARYSQLHKQRLSDPIEKAKLLIARTMRWIKPEQHSKMIEQNKKRWSNPEERSKLAKRNQSEIARKKLSETRKRQWSDPVYRAMMNLAAGRKTYSFISPSGESYSTSDLACFCRQHGLELSAMCKVSNGKAKTHRGWTRGQ